MRLYRDSAHPVKAVIFDQDGVLISFNAAVIATSLGSNLPTSLEELSQLWDEWGRAAQYNQHAEDEEALWHSFIDFIADEYALDRNARAQLHSLDYTSIIRPLPDARPALLEAHRRGLRIAVLSKFSLSGLVKSLEAVGLADLLDIGCAATVADLAKPKPEVYLGFLEQLGVTPDQCLFFDDELFCVKGARALELRAYHVNRKMAHHNLADGMVRGLTALSHILD